MHNKIRGGSEMKKEFLHFEKARELVQKLKLKNQKEWREFCNSGKRPENIPSGPSITYKDNGGWTNWGDWLGT